MTGYKRGSIAILPNVEAEAEDVHNLYTTASRYTDQQLIPFRSSQLLFLFFLFNNLKSPSFSMFSLARQFSGVRSKPLAFSQKFTRSTQVPHRLYSNPPRSSPPRAPSAPQSSRSNFPIIPIILITVISSGAYVYLVKSRTGVPTSRQN